MLHKLICILPLTICFFLSNIAHANDSLVCDIEASKLSLSTEQEVAYWATGTGPVIVLIHGLFTDKGTWRNMICGLSNAGDGYRIIAPDLPGFGDSQSYELAAYSLEQQVMSLHMFFEQLDLSEFHIAGNSMGGAIAALYTEKYPNDILSLAFIGSPLGISEFSESFKSAILQGINPFIPETREAFNIEMNLLFAKPPQISDSQIDVMLYNYRDNNKHYVQVWNIVNLYNNVLTKLLINKKTLILWGEQDDIFNVSGVQTLSQLFSDVSVIRLKDIGHLPQIEAPHQVIDHYHRFIQSQY